MRILQLIIDKVWIINKFGKRNKKPMQDIFNKIKTQLPIRITYIQLFK